MFDELVKNLILVKQDFAKKYTGNAHIQEVIPSVSSEKFPLDTNHLKSLHEFAQRNPIYFNSFQQNVAEIPCMVYEGDINQYWLNSIKHGSSCQPFYPTWIMSAFILAAISKELHKRELVDIGSGDGRIAFCGKLLGLDCHSIEIDNILVELQNTIKCETHQEFNPKCVDSLQYDYALLNLKNPVFFIGGLAQMGGDILATDILEKIKSIPDIFKQAVIVFTGTNSKKQLSNDTVNGGWDSFIKKHDLEIINTVMLPTVWTFDQNIVTPYIYTKFN